MYLMERQDKLVFFAWAPIEVQTWLETQNNSVSHSYKARTWLSAQTLAASKLFVGQVLVLVQFQEIYIHLNVFLSISIPVVWIAMTNQTNGSHFREEQATTWPSAPEVPSPAYHEAYLCWPRRQIALLIFWATGEVTRFSPALAAQRKKKKKTYLENSTDWQTTLVNHEIYMPACRLR